MENIFLIFDDNHGKNNIFNKVDDKFYLHKNIIETIISRYPQYNKHYILGEPINYKKTFNYKDKEITVDGEELIENQFEIKLLNGITTIAAKVLLTKQKLIDDDLIIIDRIKEKLKFHPNEHYLKLIEYINILDFDNIKETLLLIVNLYGKDSLKMWFSSTFPNILSYYNPNILVPVTGYLYNETLRHRDESIVKYINTIYKPDTLYCIIIGSLHKDNIMNGLHYPNYLIINTEEKVSSDLYYKKYLKYKTKYLMKS